MARPPSLVCFVSFFVRFSRHRHFASFLTAAVVGLPSLVVRVRFEGTAHRLVRIDTGSVALVATGLVISRNVAAKGRKQHKNKNLRAWRAVQKGWTCGGCSTIRSGFGSRRVEVERRNRARYESNRNSSEISPKSNPLKWGCSFLSLISPSERFDSTDSGQSTGKHKALIKHTYIFNATPGLPPSAGHACGRPFRRNERW